MKKKITTKIKSWRYFIHNSKTTSELSGEDLKEALREHVYQSWWWAPKAQIERFIVDGKLCCRICDADKKARGHLVLEMSSWEFLDITEDDVKDWVGTDIIDVISNFDYYAKKY
jgi:hypothetical protein